MSENIRIATNVDENIKSLLNDVAAEEGIRNYKIVNINNSDSEKGDRYIGTITGIQITGEDEKSESRIVNLIVKKATDDLRKQVPVEFIFEREIFMYSTVFPNYRKLETERFLPPSHLSPKLYRALMQNENETLILENLKTSGYSLYERRKPMDEEHVSLVMAEYGRFHALSFALRDQKPETFKNTVGSLSDLFLLFVRAGFKYALINRCDKSKNVLDSNTEVEAMRVYENFVSSIGQFCSDLEKEVDEYSVSIHGDPWTNNMMFKYEDEENKTKPTEVCFIDFQASRMASPVLDLSYFLYAYSSKQVMDNLDHYLRLYHSTFSTYLRKLGSNPDKLFPFTVLQQHWKKFARYSLIMSVIGVHIMLTEKDEAVDFSEYFSTEENMAKVFVYEISQVAEYSKRVRDIILHFVANNFN